MGGAAAAAVAWWRGGGWRRGPKRSAAQAPAAQEQACRLPGAAGGTFVQVPRSLGKPELISDSSDSGGGDRYDEQPAVQTSLLPLSIQFYRSRNKASGIRRGVSGALAALASRTTTPPP